VVPTSQQVIATEIRELRWDGEIDVISRWVNPPRAAYVTRIPFHRSVNIRINHFITQSHPPYP